MIPGLGKLPDWQKGVVFKVLAFLSLALAPIGVIAVLQSQEVAEQNVRIAEQSLITTTNASASRERNILERAFGAASALGTILAAIDRPNGFCRQYLADFLKANPGYRFAGFVNSDGVMECSTQPNSFDLGSTERFLALKMAPRSAVDVNFAVPQLNETADTVYQPIFLEEKLRGFFLISVPTKGLGLRERTSQVDDPESLITFASSGTILFSELPRDEIPNSLPQDVSLESLTNETSRVFDGIDAAGDRKIYSKISIIPGAVYALGVWSPDQPAVAGLRQSLWVGFSPILMWAASVLVAMFSLERLVIRPVRILNKQMDNFALRRELPDVQKSGNMPAEFISMQENFRQMAYHVTQDEAELEDLIHRLDSLVNQKTLLLKEVHHRVKNNLQLISSIINMQLRGVEDPETRSVLRRLQDRIMGLASAHQVLHQSDTFDNLDAALLLEDLTEQLTRIASDPDTKTNIELKTDHIYLLPDQAVPFSLLASELVTNALKYAGMPGVNDARIMITLRDEGDRNVFFSVTNDLKDVRPNTSGTGLGMQLMRAFATQLEAELERIETDEKFEIRIQFQALDVKPQTLDY